QHHADHHPDTDGNIEPPSGEPAEERPDADAGDQVTHGCPAGPVALCARALGFLVFGHDATKHISREAAPVSRPPACSTRGGVLPVPGTPAAERPHYSRLPRSPDVVRKSRQPDPLE